MKTIEYETIEELAEKLLAIEDKDRFKLVGILFKHTVDDLKAGGFNKWWTIGILGGLAAIGAYLCTLSF